MAVADTTEGQPSQRLFMTLCGFLTYSQGRMQRIGVLRVGTAAEM
jgi:hypothetical protein